MAEEAFLDTFEREGADPFGSLEKDTPSESLTEKESEKGKPAGGESTPEENIPFHKDARWIKREEELKELRERDEIRAKELEDLKAFKEETARRFTPSDTKVPEWFKELYGDNPSAWQKYSEYEEQKEQERERKLTEKQEQVQRKQAEETAHWNRWVETEISTLQSEGNTFDRNKLIKTMLDYRPTDEHGNFDFKAGLKIYQALEEKENPAKSDARKELADTATRSTTRGEKPKRDYKTPADLRHRSWSNLI